MIRNSFPNLGEKNPGIATSPAFEDALGSCAFRSLACTANSIHQLASEMFCQL